MERCGKINAANSGSESWTGIGVVAGFWAVVLIMQWPHGKKSEGTGGSGLLQRLQKVRANCKTRNQLDVTRLSRNCSDWYPLLDLCGYRNCLIADRDGIYDPGSPNGRLLLGLKGQISEL